MFCILLVYPRFTYYHCKHWIYKYTNNSADNKSNDNHLVVIVISNDFNPEKYQAFTKILHLAFLKKRKYNKLIDLYLSVIIDGSCNSDGNGTLTFKEFDQRKIMADTSNIKSIIKMFGLDIILIYTALILKKQIAVYHHNLDTLLQFIRSLPGFVWHRNNWDQILYPVNDLSSNFELEELRSQNHYIAGFLDADIENKPDLYDICVNLAAVEITISHSSREYFTMTKTHKDIAIFMSRQAESSLSDYEVIQEINGKTKELIKTLVSMGSDSTDEEVINENSKQKITLDNIKAKNLSFALETFLFNLAVAEDLV